MIRITRKLCRQTWRSFGSSSETLAKEELRNLIASSKIEKIPKAEPHKHIKLVDIQPSSNNVEDESSEKMKKTISSIKTTQSFSNFYMDNREIINGGTLVALTAQLFEIFHRLQRGGATLTMKMFLEQPDIQKTFEEILSKYRSLNISQLAAFLGILNKEGYYNTAYFSEIEKHLKTRDKDGKFTASLNHYLRCLTIINDSGVTLDITADYLKSLVSANLHQFERLPCYKVAGLIYYYHKLMDQLANQHQQALKDAKRRALKTGDAETESIERLPQVEVDPMHNTRTNESSGKENVGEIPAKFVALGCSLIDFDPLLEKTIEGFDLPAIALALNGYALIKKAEKTPSIRLLVDKLLKENSLNTIDDILKVLKACVNVRIYNPEIFNKILERSVQLLTQHELTPMVPFTPYNWLMLHYYLVKVDVALVKSRFWRWTFS
jgi:hypothetical protein